MKVDAVDLFYLAMPVVTDAADGSQDALVVRVAAGGHVGWGECEASPLVCIAAFVTPMSHGACRPVRDAVLGKPLDGPDDIARMAAEIAWNSMDLLQAPHVWSGIEIALWDLLGRVRGEPVWRMLGHARAEPKRPYASVLFGDDPHETLQRARAIAADGYKAGKFGWGPIGRGGVAADADQFAAAREGLGPDATLLIDAGQIWGEDVDAAALRLPALDAAGAVWLEEPFAGHAVGAYRALAQRGARVRLAGGEASHDVGMARHLIEDGGIGFIQIDCGRVGGIAPGFAIARHAARRGIMYVNHTFTSHLALSASLQPFAGLADHGIAEYPVHASALARELTVQRILRDAAGNIRAPDAPGLGVDVEHAALRRYGVAVEIRVRGELLHATPTI